MVNADQMPRPDVNDMISVHRVFRDTLGAAPQLWNAPEAGDAARAGMLANFYDNILSFLHVHHGGEDVLLFPLLRERAVDDRDLVERISGQHRDVDDLLMAAESALATCSSGGASDRAAAADALTRLLDRLGEHLDAEERDILPLCLEHMTMPEWGALPAHGMQHFEGDKIWLILGLLMQRMTPEQRADVMAHMPPPALEMWQGFGEQAFSELMAQVGPPLARPAAPRQRTGTPSQPAEV